MWCKICVLVGATAASAILALAPRPVRADDSEVTYTDPIPPEVIEQATRRLEIVPWTGEQYFTQAQAAFKEGQYRNAYRLASHAAIEEAQNAKAHEFRALCMFAIGDYAGASREAHRALELGQPASWNTLVGYYGNDVRDYTQQLRALEKFSAAHPDDADAHFVLGYHYLMTQYLDTFTRQMSQVVKQNLQDVEAANLLKLYGESAKSTAKTPPAGKSG